MTTIKIDEAIERYVSERKKSERKVAENKFLSYAYLACGESDTATFMRRARGLIRYYIDYLTVLENPLRGPQAGWLALMSIVFCFGIYMMGNEDLCMAGIFVTSGTTQCAGMGKSRFVIGKNGRKFLFFLNQPNILCRLFEGNDLVFDPVRHS